MPCRSKKMNIMKVYIHILQCEPTMSFVAVCQKKTYIIFYFIILYAHCANIPPLASSTFTSFHAYALHQGFHFDNPTDAESNPRVWTIIVYLRTMIHSHVTWEVYTPSGCGKLSIYSHPSECRIIYAEIPFLELQFVIKRIVLLQLMPATKCKNEIFQPFVQRYLNGDGSGESAEGLLASVAIDGVPNFFHFVSFAGMGGKQWKNLAKSPKTTGRNPKTAPFRKKVLNVNFYKPSIFGLHGLHFAGIMHYDTCSNEGHPVLQIKLGHCDRCHHFPQWMVQAILMWMVGSQEPGFDVSDHPFIFWQGC